MSSTGFLQQDDYYQVIRTTTLTSIDIIPMSENKILVGMRRNSPARGYWFVPGSRTGKGEIMSEAIKRITRDEMGKEFTEDMTRHIGCYDHIYPDNFRDTEFGTHYVVNTFLLPLQQEDVENIVVNEQHSEFKWIDIGELENDERVHQFVKNYIPAIISNKEV